MASASRCFRTMLSAPLRPMSAGRSCISISISGPAPAPAARRFLNMDTAPILYSARAKVKGARTGRVEGDDLKIELTMAKALGGSGDKGKTNPEELFAAGYGACFQSSMNAVAPSVIMGLDHESQSQSQSATSSSSSSNGAGNTAKTGQSDRAGMDSIEGDEVQDSIDGDAGVKSQGKSNKSKSQNKPDSAQGQAGKATATTTEGKSTPNKKPTTTTNRIKPKMPGDPEDSVVDTTVHLVGDMKKLDMGIRVDMRVGVRGLPRPTVERIVQRALEICPYSRAIKGNVTTRIEVVDL